MRIWLRAMGVLCLLAAVAPVAAALIVRYAVYSTLPLEDLWPAFTTSVVAGVVLLAAFALSSLAFGLAGNLRLLEGLKASEPVSDAGEPDRGDSAAAGKRPEADSLRDWLRALGVLLLATAFLLAWYLGLRSPSRYWTSVYQSSAVAAALTAAVLVLLAAAACLSLGVAKGLYLRARLAVCLLLLRAGTAEQDTGSAGSEDDPQTFSETPDSTRRMRDWLQAAGVLCLVLAPVTVYNLLVSTRAYLAFPSWDLVALMWGWAVALGLVMLSFLSFGAIRGLDVMERIAEQLRPPVHPNTPRGATAYLYISGVLCLLPTPLLALFPSEWDYALDGSLEAFVALLALGTTLATLSALSFAAAKDRYLLSVIASQLESDQSAASAGPEAHLPAADVISPPSAAVTAYGLTSAPRPRSALGRAALVALGVLAVCATTLLCYRQAMLRRAPVEAGMLAYSGRYEDALAAYDWAIRANPDDANAYSSRGALLARLHRDGKALTALRRAVELDPRDAGAYTNMAAVLVRHGRGHEALAAAGRAVRLRPGDPSAHSARAWVLAKLGKYDEALAAYNRVIAIRPDDAWAHFNRGSALSKLGRYREALQAYDQVIQLEPRDAAAYRNKGWVLTNLHRYGEALQAYDRAIQLKPEDPNAHDNRGWVLANLGRHEDALKEFDRAIHLDPTDPIPYADMGRSLAALGRPREALAAYERAVELDPDCVYARYSRARALGKMGRHKEALAEFSRITQLQPDDERAHFGKGYELAELGRNEEAIAAYDRAIELRPDDAYAHYNRACAYAMLGRTKQALSDLARAVELDGELRETARTEEDLSGLRSDPEFKRLVAKRR